MGLIFKICNEFYKNKNIKPKDKIKIYLVKGENLDEQKD